MVWGFFHSHGMYSGISLDKWASVSSTGGLEDTPDFGTVKNNHAGHRSWVHSIPGLSGLSPILNRKLSINGVPLWIKSLVCSISVFTKVLRMATASRCPEAYGPDDKLHDQP